MKKKQAALEQESDEENVMEVKEFRVNEDRSRVHHDTQADQLYKMMLKNKLNEKNAFAVPLIDIPAL